MRMVLNVYIALLNKILFYEQTNCFTAGNHQYNCARKPFFYYLFDKLFLRLDVLIN